MQINTLATIPFVGLLFMTLFGCTSEPPLKLEFAEPSEVTGTYTLILFDSGLGNGIQRIAVLDGERDKITFEPYAPEREFKKLPGLSGPEALRRAEAYLNMTPQFQRTQLSRIKNRTGETIGFEMRPLYQRIAFGTNDVLDINYRPSDDTVFIHMKLIDSVERTFRGGS
ncbi:MAG TPA: hypothetical protein VK445_08950 [Dissulfurispiraceae bacterium]|nr:hypothetical protein [Dissulfurispiraceae bacterium]